MKGPKEEHAVSDRNACSPGRPRKADAERRRHRLTISLSDAERADIEERARALKMVPSVYLRQAATGGATGAAAGAKLMKRREDLLYHRISRLGVRLLQMAKRAAAEGRGEEQAAMERLAEEVRAIRAML